MPLKMRRFLDFAAPRLRKAVAGIDGDADIPVLAADDGPLRAEDDGKPASVTSV
jgi:hypothetical protein